MKKSMILPLFLAVLGGFASAAEIKFESGFEDGLVKWDIPESRAQVSLTGTAASGKQAAEIRFDPAGKPERRHCGVLWSKKIPATRGIYRVTGKIQLAEGYGATVGIEFYDRQNRKLGNNGYHYGSAPPSKESWLNVDFKGAAFPDETGYAMVKLYIPYGVRQTIRLDDIRLERLPSDPVPPPWKPQYKIRPEEKAKLTAADFPGPDGIVYPDFTYAGARNEILKRAGRTKIRLNVKDGEDIARPLRQAIDALPADGGTVEIPAGSFRMGEMVTVTKDFVTIKGAGSGRTRLDFTYDAGENRVDLYGIRQGDKIAPGQPVHLYARPAELRSLKLEADGKEFGKYTRSLHSGNHSFFVQRLPGNLEKGKHRLRGTAEYLDGRQFTTEAEIMIDPAVKPTLPERGPSSFIHFRGKGFSSADYKIAQDGGRGDSSVILRDEKHPFKAGDFVILRALETPARRAVTGNACNWGSFRSTHLFITKVQGTKLTFNQPLRLDYPAADESFVRKLGIIRGGRVEGMTLETKNDYWLNSVQFEYASDCVARDLKVIRCGRNPVYAGQAKFCSILDCEFDGSWYNGGGGTAYVGWDNCSDCLTDGIVTRRMRHAPVVQWGASGNVIRNGKFYNCDSQWHAGWSTENLFENCTVISDTKEFGGYGNAFFASSPEDGAHGPNGPRNVVYNCDAYSVSDAVYLGGMNENWIFAYNRFRVKKGYGFFFKTASFDHILKQNVVILEDGSSPFLLLATPDCGGVELIGNTLSGGNGKLSAGLHRPLQENGNKVVPLDTKLERPRPKVPSIYEWQLKNKR
ncbi:MAG: hypothetical protein HPZ91_01620 [Lentisphaeria bacterium]|nr:hypothetical protein [Lentisphaeria bacterium]